MRFEKLSPCRRSHRGSTFPSSGRRIMNALSQMEKGQVGRRPDSHFSAPPFLISNAQIVSSAHNNLLLRSKKALFIFGARYAIFVASQESRQHSTLAHCTPRRVFVRVYLRRISATPTKCRRCHLWVSEQKSLQLLKHIEWD
jgi:hypothetical protein